MQTVFKADTFGPALSELFLAEEPGHVFGNVLPLLEKQVLLHE